MAEVKWIKICTDIFDDEKIALIDGMPERDGILVIWFKLLCMAGKQNNGGVFMLNDKIAYTDEMLATIFRRPLNTVRLALNTFEQFGMVDIINNAYTIPNWEKHQSLDKLEAAKEKTRLRVAAHREKQKLLAANGVTICQYCGGTATGLDHIIPLARGGKDIESNTVPCCIDCNRKKNDKPLVDFLNANRSTIDDGIVTANEKLSKFVSLCNVTDRYIVTPCNAIDKEEDIDIDKDKDNRGKTNRNRFVPPTLAEVSAYVAERNSNVNPQEFIDFYESKGWMVGKNKMKDWKAACRNAEKWDRWNKPQSKVGANGIPINNQKSDLEGVF